MVVAMFVVDAVVVYDAFVDLKFFEDDVAS